MAAATVTQIVAQVPGDADTKARLAQAHAYYNAKRYEEAHDVCMQIYRAAPSRADNLLLLGATCFHFRDYEGCARYNLEAIQVNPSFAEAYGNLGNARRSQGKLGEATQQYVRAIKLKPTFLEAYNNLAATYVDMNLTQPAISTYQASLAVNPKQFDAWLTVGRLHRNLGAVAKARDCFVEALRVRPDCAAAWSNLAAAMKDTGAPLKTVIDYYKEAIRLDPTLADAHSNMGNALKESGQLGAAKEAYEEAIKIKPDFAIAFANLGACFYDEGAMRTAASYYLRAIELEPKFPDALNNLGNAYRELGDLDGSIRCYRAALQADSTHPHAHNNLGNSLKDKGFIAEAIECYRAACRLMPRFAAAHSNLASVWKEQGQIGEALKHYNQALLIDPTFADAYSNMGNAFKDSGRLDLAIKLYATAIGHKPVFPDAFSNLASALKDSGKVEEAVVCYRKALEQRPEFPDAFSNLVHSLVLVCDWRHRREDFDRLRVLVSSQLEQNERASAALLQLTHGGVAAAAGTAAAASEALVAPQSSAMPASTAASVSAAPGSASTPTTAQSRVPQLPILPAVQPFHSLVYPMSLHQMQRLAASYARRAQQTAAAARAPPISLVGLSPPSPRVRIGYVSSDFGNHPLAHLMQSVFGLHDKRQVEVFCFSLSADDGSPWRRKISSEVEHFIDISALGHAQAAALIRQHNIHVLVNLNGYTKGARNEIFALRPAPVQVSYMGFCGTMGADFIDYLITDESVVPDQFRRFYTESIVYMPHYYFVNDHRQSARFVLDRSQLPVRETYGIPTDKFVFANFNQIYKIDPETFRVWCNILRRVPNSVLWLLRFPPAGEANIRTACRAFGLPDDRIIFTGVVQKEQHLGRGPLVDLFLDTPVCNAHTTGCDILWGGVPIVTAPGEKMASRVAASLLNACGLRECIARDMQDYEELAVQLALDRPRLTHLRRSLESQRDSCLLFDTKRWTANFEAALLRLWEHRAAGEQPAVVRMRDVHDGSRLEPVAVVAPTPGTAAAMAAEQAAAADETMGVNDSEGEEEATPPPAEEVVAAYTRSQPPVPGLSAEQIAAAAATPPVTLPVVLPQAPASPLAMQAYMAHLAGPMMMPTPAGFSIIHQHQAHQLAVNYGQIQAGYCAMGIPPVPPMGTSGVAAQGALLAHAAQIQPGQVHEAQQAVEAAARAAGYPQVHAVAAVPPGLAATAPGREPPSTTTTPGAWYPGVPVSPGLPMAGPGPAAVGSPAVPAGLMGPAAGLWGAGGAAVPLAGQVPGGLRAAAQPMTHHGVAVRGMAAPATVGPGYMALASRS